MVVRPSESRPALLIFSHCASTSQRLLCLHVLPNPLAFHAKARLSGPVGLLARPGSVPPAYGPNRRPDAAVLSESVHQGGYTCQDSPPRLTASERCLHG